MMKNKMIQFFISGFPSLTVYEEIRLVNDLLNHPLDSALTMTEAELFSEKYVTSIAQTNYCHQMPFVRKEFFFDFLLKYPHIILKHRQWFENFQPSLMPSSDDRIQLKKWQLGTLLNAHIALEQSFI